MQWRECWSRGWGKQYEKGIDVWLGLAVGFMQLSRKKMHRQPTDLILIILLWLRIFSTKTTDIAGYWLYIWCVHLLLKFWFLPGSRRWCLLPEIVGNQGPPAIGAITIYFRSNSVNGIPKTLEVQSYFIAKLLFWFFPHFPPSKHPFQYHDYHTNISTKHQTFNWCGVRWGNPMYFVIVFLFDFPRRLMASSCFLVPWYQSFQTPVQIPTKIQMVL